MDDVALEEVIPRGCDSTDSEMPQYTGHLELSSNKNGMSISIHTSNDSWQHSSRFWSQLLANT